MANRIAVWIAAGSMLAALPSLAQTPKLKVPPGGDPAYAFGAGPERKLNMGWQRLDAGLDNGVLRADRGSGRRIELRLDDKGGMVLQHLQGVTTLTATLYAAE